MLIFECTQSMKKTTPIAISENKPENLVLLPSKNPYLSVFSLICGVGLGPVSSSRLSGFVLSLSLP